MPPVRCAQVRYSSASCGWCRSVAQAHRILNSMLLQLLLLLLASLVHAAIHPCLQLAYSVLQQPSSFVLHQAVLVCRHMPCFHPCRSWCLHEALTSILCGHPDANGRQSAVCQCGCRAGEHNSRICMADSLDCLKESKVVKVCCIAHAAPLCFAHLCLHALR